MRAIAHSSLAQNTQLTLIALLASLCLAGCNQSHAKETRVMPSALESLGPIRTHCIGRYLIDLPDTFSLTKGSDVQLIYGLGEDFRKVKVQVPKPDGDEAAYKYMVSERIRELKRDESFKSPSKNMLAWAAEVESGGHLIRAYDSPDSVQYFVSQLFALKRAHTVLVQQTVHKRDHPEDIESHLLRVSQGITAPVTLNETGPGTCLGPVLINAGQDGEWFTATWTSKRWPDAKFSMYINSMRAEGDGGLLARWDRKIGDLIKLGGNFDYIRKGKRTIAGRPGEEILTKGIEGGKEERHFKGEIPVAAPSTFASPFTTFEFEMGGQNDKGEYIDPSLSQEQALALWDAALNSVRLRPGSMPPSSK